MQLHLFSKILSQETKNLLLSVTELDKVRLRTKRSYGVSEMKTIYIDATVTRIQATTERTLSTVDKIIPRAFITSTISTIVLAGLSAWLSQVIDAPGILPDLILNTTTIIIATYAHKLNRRHAARRAAAEQNEHYAMLQETLTSLNDIIHTPHDIGIVVPSHIHNQECESAQA